MRYLRSKHIRKALRQFQFLCGIKPPYKVLLDGNFIAMCLKMNVDIATRVPKFLQTDKCIFMVTAAAVNELKVLGAADKDMLAAWNLAKTFQTVDGSGDDVTAAMLAAVGERNERKYIVATQETELRAALRRVPGVPLIYLNRSVLVFEDMSEATLRISRKEDHLKMTKLNAGEESKLQAVLKAEVRTPEDSGVKARLHKKAKAPNPLSMKKSSKPKKVRTKKKKPE
ncbi:rRNA-processing protein [Achlya hypogyna]|uniref:rRNA-processing protein n=1 Tax=Achlya hypogyna TaxID=1202772 RepID=A0A1V9YHZ0_ACHHY|nr:rRNA-processing protein [Achlya hypogyna]